TDAHRGERSQGQEGGPAVETAKRDGTETRHGKPRESCPHHRDTQCREEALGKDRGKVQSGPWDCPDARRPRCRKGERRNCDDEEQYEKVSCEIVGHNRQYVRSQRAVRSLRRDCVPALQVALRTPKLK